MVRMWMQLKLCVLCVCVCVWGGGGVLQRGHSGVGCDLASTLSKYDLESVIYLFWVGQGCDE